MTKRPFVQKILSTNLIYGFFAVLAALAWAVMPLSRSPRAYALGPITEYPVASGSTPLNLVAGPDGATWFTEFNGNKIGRIASSGAITHYALPTANASPRDITTGPDGALWFTESDANKIGRITTAGAITEYSIATPPSNLQPYGITTGPDGALWFTEFNGNKVGRISTSGVLLSEYQLTFASPTSITTGPDGAMWFGEYGTNKIARLSTSFAFTEYTIPTSNAYPISLTSGPDGALWFTELIGNKIGRVSTTGSFTEYALANSPAPYHITSAAGNLWFTELNGNNIAQITPSGIVTEYPLPTTNVEPVGITLGSDGDLWFAEESNNIGRYDLNPAPDAPTNLMAASPTNQAPSLSWTAVSGAASYNVYRDSALLANTTSPSFTDATATEGTHNYYVTAVNSGGESGPSNTVSVLLDKTAPVVTVTPVAGSSLTGTVTFTITVTDNDALDPAKNTSIWVYMYNTAAGQKSWGAKVNLSRGTGTFTIDTTKLDNGNANLDVGRVLDAANNASGRTDTYFRNYTIIN